MQSSNSAAEEGSRSLKMDKRLMYEGEGIYRKGPFSMEFAPIERIGRLYRTPEVVRGLIGRLFGSDPRSRHGTEPKLAR